MLRKALIVLFIAGLVSALASVPAGAVNAQLEETWDGYTSGSTPYGTNGGWNWELKNGEWMGLTSQARSGAQSYSIGSGQTSQITYAIDATGTDHVAVQGWLYDSGDYSGTWLGLGNHETVNNSLIRIGTNHLSEYQVQYGEFVASTGIASVSTTLPVEAGWHYTRLDIVNLNFLGLWQCTWLIDSADRSVRKTGTFSWFFDKASATRVYVGSDQMTFGAVAWDDIKVGSYEFVGPAPAIPEPGGMLALGTGLIGLAGIVRRRKA